MSSTILVAMGILASSFFGSWHCAGMCGPIATLMGQRQNLYSYHIGRLLSYLLLGFLAGYLGQFFLNSDFIAIRWISAILFAGILISMGLRWIAPLWLVQLLPRIESHKILGVIRRFQKFHLKRSGFAVGLLTALLPCGWLYTYVTAAIATKSPYSGVVVMLLFWLGTVPALAVVPAMIRKSIQTAPLKHQRIAGVILVTAGLYSLISFWFLH